MVIAVFLGSLDVVLAEVAFAGCELEELGSLLDRGAEIDFVDFSETVLPVSSARKEGSLVETVFADEVEEEEATAGKGAG